MSQELGLSPRECARNAGVFLLIRLSLGLIIFFSLNTIFPLPSEVMLGAAMTIRTNVLLFVGMIAVLFFMALFSLIVAFPLNNVLTSVNRVLSKGAQVSRWIELVIFIVGMILLFADIALYYQVLLIGMFVYALYLSLIGYLVFISGYLSRVLGATMIVAGLIGYLMGGLTGFTFLVSTIFAYIALVSEVVFAIYFVAKAMQINVTDPKETISMILADLGEATTAEIIDESSRVSAECKDRIPEALVTLEAEEKVTKRFSKEKKGYVWSLVD